MNYARLNFLQLDRLEQTRMSWGALCYEIARGGGACMHFNNDEHRRLVAWLRIPQEWQGLEAVATDVLRALDAVEDAETFPLELESMTGAARVLSPVAVKAIGAACNAHDDRRLQALFDQIDSVPRAGAATMGDRCSEALRGLMDFYRRAAARGQYLLLAEMAHSP